MQGAMAAWLLAAACVLSVTTAQDSSPPYIRTQDGSIILETAQQAEVQLMASDVRVSLTGRDAFTLGALYTLVQQQQARLDAYDAIFQTMFNSPCSGGDTVASIATDGTLNCARSQPVHGSCDSDTVMTGVNGATGEVTCSAFSVQQRVAGTCEAGSSVREVHADGTVTCETPSSSVWQRRIDAPCTAGTTVSSVNEDGSVSCAAPDETVWQKRVSFTCADDESIRVVNTDGSVVCHQDKDTVYVEDEDKWQRRVTGSCPVGHSIRQVNTDGNVECELDDAPSDSLWQKRVTATCPAGSSMRVIKEDGTVDCEVDDDTDPSPSVWQKRLSTACPTGESVTGVAEDGTVSCESPDKDVWQKRVAATCPDGQSIRIINADGTITCYTDKDTPPSPSEWQRRVTDSCPQGQSIRIVAGDGTVTCEVDDNTVYVEDSGKWQRRVTASCPSGQSIRVVNEDGTVTCQVDQDTPPSPTEWQKRVTAKCDPEQSIREVKQDGTVVCEADTDTVYVPDPDKWQQRVSGQCLVGHSIRIVHTDGTVTCEQDDDTAPSNTVWQTRITGTCPVGHSIRVVNTDGTVSCEQDDAPSDDVWQKRVAGTCPTGQSIRVVNTDGTVTCEVDSDTVYVEDATKWQQRVTGACPDGQSIRQVKQDGTVTCYTDKDTPPSASEWQKRVTGTCGAGFSIRVISSTGTVTCEKDDDTVYVEDATKWQKRVSGTCATGNSVRVINEDGTVACEADDNYIPSATEWQKRVTGTCGAGYSIRVIASTGAVTCEADDNYVPTSSEWQKRVSGTCASGSSVRVINADGTVACETDDNYVPQDSVWQKRITTACPVGQSIRAVSSTGGVTCQADSSSTGSYQAVVSGFCAAGTSIRAINSDGSVVCDPADTSAIKEDHAKFVHWGRRTCSAGVQIYSGFVAGSHYTHQGSGTDYLCMPENPEYSVVGWDAGNQNGGLLYRTEYETSGDPVAGFSSVHDQEAACAVCSVSADQTIMVPGRNDCAGNGNLQKLYDGWMMADYHSHSHTSQFLCVDKSPQSIYNTDTGSENGALLYTVELETQPSGSGYTINREVSCSVCALKQASQPRTVFTRWGRQACGSGTTEIYRGWVGSGHYSNQGSGGSQQCMPYSPAYNPGGSTADNNRARIFFTEYQTSGYGIPSFNALHDQEVPCAVCMVTGHVAEMFPATRACPSGWTELYEGWVMAEHYTHVHTSEFICVDRNAQAASGSNGGNQDGNLLYPTEIENPINSNYKQDMEVPCTVCSLNAVAGKDYSVFRVWGKRSCPQMREVDMVYNGWLGSGAHDHHGSGYSQLCMPDAPNFGDQGSAYYTSNQNGALIYRTEYETSGYGIPGFQALHDRDVPCSVCKVPSADVVMIAGRVNCPVGFTVMYTGYLMGTHYTQIHPSEHICVHEAAEPYPSANGNSNGNLLYPVEFEGPPPGPGVGYVHDREIACVVCAVGY